jgi:phospholipid/cholesterol/gamma-HCH transport system substrate-binding protein
MMAAEDEQQIDHEAGRGIGDQIERYRTAFLAIVAMIVIAAGSAGYILAHERLSVPAWVPVIGQESFPLKGEFSTGQAVTPGQGQSVEIAGAKIGEISSVELVGGRAIVSMNVTPKYARYIYRNATMLLRPKTGLKDETVEVSPGTPAAGRVSKGYVVPITQTSPDGNLDELLASLDTDTRAYLQELLAGAGEALNGNSANFSATFKRFDPLAREFQEIGREVAKRQYYVEHGIHNFRLLLEALGSKDTQLAQVVDSANAVFATFSQQDRAVQETLRELPGVLKQANHGFGKIGGSIQVVGSTLHALEPFAKALAPAQRAAQESFRTTTPIFKNEVRPFFRKILPVINQLQPSLQDFAQATPQLTTSFTVLSEFFNELAYNPGPNQAGFLFFADWGAHDLDSVVSQGEAHGAIGQTLLYFNCELVPILTGVAEADPTAKLILGLLNPPSASLCKSAAASGTAAAKAASVHGVGAAARLADRVFGQGPDAAALAQAPLGGGG